ncbi:MerC domain-containing protein [Nevskia sp.]|uniref:MerC domain-containing protein n=1 Tax=Nevskia sp. TaxID=1929292 RepID=UPI0025E4D10A|nr:MerC domain-containing protein [Nevskia sp.]
MKLPADLSAAADAPPIRGLDGLAMLFSALCLVHCLALPVLVAALPLAASSFVADERFHQWLLLGAVPTSLIALGWGWRRHRQPLVAWLGSLGMGFMVFAAFGIEFGLLDALGERALTIVGAVLLAVAHLRNYQLRHHGHDHSRPHAH